MKITQFYGTDKPDPNHLLLALDVSSRSLDLYGRYHQDGTEYEVSESLPNELTTIANRLDYYARQARLLGPYYHRKISEGMPGRKAEVASMRKLLNILYGAARSRQSFDPDRVFCCTG